MKPRAIWGRFSVLRPFIHSHWQSLLVGLIGLVLSVLFELPAPLLQKYLIDNVLLASQSTWLLSAVCLAMLGVVIFFQFSNWLKDYFFTCFGRRVTRDIKESLYRNVLGQSYAFFRERPTGYLMTRLTNDVDRLRGVLTASIFGLIRDAVLFLSATAALVVLDWRLAIVSMAMLPVFVANLFFWTKRIRRHSKVCAESDAVASALLQEGLVGVRTLQAQTGEEQSIQAYRESLHRSVQNAIAAARTSLTTVAFDGVINYFGPLAIFWYGGYQVQQGTMSIGTLVAATALLAKLVGPTRRGMYVNLRLQEAAVGLDRITEISSANTGIKPPERPRPFTGLARGIEFVDVHFGYGSQKVLQDLNLVIPVRTSIAIVGRSGVGKTTLVGLLGRFYDPNRGSVCFDGVDIREFDVTSLRGRIGIVEQEPLLFRTTVAENILLGCKRHYDLHAIERACEIANCSDFLREMPRGLETVVGERGVSLSAGQRQRIAIARAIIRDPDILIFDEATSNLDYHSEQLIQDALVRIMGNRTVIIVAHRASSIQRADQIAILHEGRIAEVGTHSHLLAESPLYQRLYSRYTTAGAGQGQ